MLSKPLDKIMFFAIETVPATETFDQLSTKLQNCFLKKQMRDIQEEAEIITNAKKQGGAIENVYQEKAALSPDFGKIAAISWGGITDTKTYTLKSNQVSGPDEKELLSLFVNKLNFIKKENGGWAFNLAGYAAKGFNIPFLCRRMLLNGMEIPAILDMENIKPWEQTHIIDVSSEWKMGLYDSYTSLETLCALFGVDYVSESPESLKKAYYDKNWPIVGDSCESKLVSLGNVYLKLKLINERLKIQAK